MDDEFISSTDIIDDNTFLVDPVSGTSFVYSKESNSLVLSENDILSETPSTDSDPVVAADPDYSSIIEEIEEIDTELVEIKEELLSSIDRSNELIGALLIVLLAHVTLMVFRKIFAIFN